MPFNINDFQSSMRFDGARPSLFEVRLFGPDALAIEFGEDASFKVKASNLPESNITPIVVKYFGRDVKFAGNRTFPDWTTTIINDEDFNIRHKLEAWHQKINSMSGNRRTLAGGGAPSAYKANAEVVQYGKTGKENILRTYYFKDIWPAVISPIELSWDTADAIEEYTCTWSFNYWTAEGPGAIIDQGEGAGGDRTTIQGAGFLGL